MSRRAKHLNVQCNASTGALEEPKTGQRRGFANFAALMAFLEGELQRPASLED